MPMDSSNHIITLENIKNDQTFTYSLVICKGFIQTKYNRCQSSFVTVYSQDSTFKTSVQHLEPSSFKVILDLKPGSNVIKICYCCSSLSLTLYYVERTSPFSVLPVYITVSGHDGTFQAPEKEANTIESAQNRITLGCRLLQSVIAEKLYEANFERKTFQLDPAGCILFQTNLNMMQIYSMSQTDLWYHFGREIMSSSIGDSKKKYVAFLSCTRYDGSGYEEGMTHDDIIKLTKGYVAFGGEGLALLGTACLHTWPESFDQIIDKFSNQSAIDEMALMNDSCYRGTFGACFATTLGATLHELCHTFDLGHTLDGIMGRGFDNMQNIFLENSLQIQSNELNIFNRRKLSDDVFFTKNCSVILNCHKWFNQFEVSKKCTISYDKQTKVIKSSVGLGVVELRKKPDDLVIKFWVFLHRVLKYQHLIDLEEFEECQDLILFIEDVKGNIFKEDF